jgi:hypothetical protein
MLLSGEGGPDSNQSSRDACITINSLLPLHSLIFAHSRYLNLTRDQADYRKPLVTEGLCRTYACGGLRASRPELEQAHPNSISAFGNDVVVAVVSLRRSRHPSPNVSSVWAAARCNSLARPTENLQQLYRRLAMRIMAVFSWTVRLPRTTLVGALEVPWHAWIPALREAQGHPTGYE